MHFTSQLNFSDQQTPGGFARWTVRLLLWTVVSTIAIGFSTASASLLVPKTEMSTITPDLDVQSLHAWLDKNMPQTSTTQTAGQSPAEEQEEPTAPSPEPEQQPVEFFAMLSASYGSSGTSASGTGTTNSDQGGSSAALLTAAIVPGPSLDQRLYAEPFSQYPEPPPNGLFHPPRDV